MKHHLLSLLCGSVAAVLSIHSVSAAEPSHPRLFFDEAAVAGFRAKADKAPWRDMLAAIEWNLERDLGSGYDKNYPSAHAMATLHLFRGSGPVPKDYAEQAKLAVLTFISARDEDGTMLWANPKFKSLSRAGRNLRTAIAYDLCHSAWVGQKIPATITTPDGKTHNVPAPYAGMDVNAGISLALKNNSDSLRENGGAGWPGNQSLANNWFAVRFGSAVIGYLACDEPEESWKQSYENCLRQLRMHYEANLTKGGGSNGWNPEGVAYSQYPGQTTFPVALALKKLRGIDLVKEFPALEKVLWATYQGMVPIERRGRTSAPGADEKGLGRGLRPDFTDDHNSWDPEGTAALAFAFSPQEYLPGLKWMFRRACGDLGDKTWDSSTGNGLWSLLYYPAELPEKNPSEVWGNTYADFTYGVFVFRNRYQDEEDFVLQTHANLRHNLGGHAGPDGLSFRIYGLGVPWCVGSGRTGDPRGQTIVFPGDPETMSSSRKPMVPSLIDIFQRQNGDGYTVMNMDTTEVGVSNLTRRIVTDYSGLSGAPGLFVISDSSNDGRWWRLNTPDFNTITTTADGFSITSPDGHVMTAKVLWPKEVKFRTGAFDRPPNFFYKAVNLVGDNPMYSTKNKWVDFEGNGDGKFLVTLAVTKKGEVVPEITATGSGVVQKITAGKRVIALDENKIGVEGWSKPVISITSPDDHATFHGEKTAVPVAGQANDPDGVARVELKLDGVSVGEAKLDGKGGWSGVLPDVGPGTHEFEAVVVDKVNDRAIALREIRISTTVPPEISMASPDAGIVLESGTRVEFSGTVKDAENALDRVEVWANGAKLAAAKVDGQRWSYAWDAAKTGVHEVFAMAFDKAGDFSRTKPQLLTLSLRFSKIERWGDAANYVVGGKLQERQAQRDGEGRWSVVEEDGDLRLKVRPVNKHDFGAHVAWMRGSEDIGKGNWRLSFQFKTGEPLDTNPECFVFFGAGRDSGMVLDLRPTNGIKPKGKNSPEGGTRVWHRLNSGPMPGVAWSLNAAIHPEAPGTDHAGIPNTGWNRVKVERVGRTLKVWVNERLILDGDHALLGTKGPIGIGNWRPYGGGGSTGFFDDIDLIPLDAGGKPASRP